MRLDLYGVRDRSVTVLIPLFVVPFTTRRTPPWQHPPNLSINCQPRRPSGPGADRLLFLLKENAGFTTL